MCGINLKFIDGQLIAAAINGAQMIRATVPAPAGCDLPFDGVTV
jgi:hypothetical protein